MHLEQQKAWPGRLRPGRERPGSISLVLGLIMICVSACASETSSNGTDGEQTGSEDKNQAQDSSDPTPVAPSSFAGDSDGSEQTVSAATLRLRSGVDVSEHSGSVDWPAVANAGYDFAIAKASEGVDLADQAFPSHWANMKQAGLVRGAYHFYVTEDDPGEQASFFTSIVQLEAGDLAPVVDIELIGHGTTPGLDRRLRTFLEQLEAHYGVRPIIYTSPNFWDQNLGSGFGDYPLWVAEYGVSEPRIPTGWEEWRLWQYKGDATVPGVEQGADLSRVQGSGEEIESLFLTP